MSDCLVSDDVRVSRDASLAKALTDLSEQSPAHNDGIAATGNVDHRVGVLRHRVQRELRLAGRPRPGNLRHAVHVIGAHRENCSYARITSAAISSGVNPSV